MIPYVCKGLSEGFWRVQERRVSLDFKLVERTPKEEVTAVAYINMRRRLSMAMLKGMVSAGSNR